MSKAPFAFHLLFFKMSVCVLGIFLEKSKHLYIILTKLFGLFVVSIVIFLFNHLNSTEKHCRVTELRSLSPHTKRVLNYFELTQHF